jgi:hypothetical protein
MNEKLTYEEWCKKYMVADIDPALIEDLKQFHGIDAVKEVPVQLPNGKVAYIRYRLDAILGKWVSLVEHQTMLDLQAYLNGEEPK